MTDVRGVLWDMDGVLVDTGEAHFDSWQQVLAEQSVPADESAKGGVQVVNIDDIIAIGAGEEDIFDRNTGSVEENG